MANSKENGGEYEAENRLWRDEGRGIPKGVETGVTKHGESRDDAVANLDEAVAHYNDEIGREPTDEELRELGIDPKDNVTGEQEPPDILKESMAQPASSGMVVPHGFELGSATGGRAKPSSVHPMNPDVCRQVTVPLNDELRTGTLWKVAE